MAETEGHVWTLRLPMDMEQVDLLLTRLEPAALLGLTEEAGVTTVWFGQLPPESVRADLRDGAAVADGWERVAAHGWDLAWREHIRPVSAGGVRIVPPWLVSPPDPDGSAVIQIEIEPAQAFGTGHHETTTLCLEELATARPAGRSVLDVGTGTGVLAIAAARQGAGPVLGCDTDPVAVRTALDNARRNGVGGQVQVVHGSVDDLPGGAPARFDVVVANLDTATVGGLAGALAARCAGRLIVSGVSCARADEAVTALTAAGVTPRRRDGHEWTVLTAELDVT